MHRLVAGLPSLRYHGGIAKDTAEDPDGRRASRLLLKAIRGLPQREQDAVLFFLLERALVNPRDTETGIPTIRTHPANFPGFAPRGWAWPPEPSGQRAIAALILQRLAAGDAVDQIARALGIDSALLHAVLQDLAARPRSSGRLCSSTAT